MTEPGGTSRERDSGSRPGGRTPDDLFAGRYLSVETPERVDLGFHLADLGSRFGAFVLDVMVIAVSTILLLVVTAFLLRTLGTDLSSVVGGFANWVVGAVMLAYFALIWGYFPLFEGLRDGQTPGKRVLGIRVVDDRGAPVDMRAAAVRGLLRLLDFLGFGAVGGAVAFLHPRTKRVGDLAAGTLVVRDRASGELPEEIVRRDAAGPPRLTDAEFEALHRYGMRREGLPPKVRREFAARLADRIDGRVRWDRESVPADDHVAAVYEDESARRAATSGRIGGVSREAVALVRGQTPTWRDYRDLLGAADGGLDRLDSAHIPRFASLYREVAADLARARTYGGSPQLVYALERMVAGGHNLIYRATGQTWRSLVRWLSAGFPRLVRRRWRPIALAGLLFYLPALIVYTAVTTDPDLAYDVVPVGMVLRAQDGAEREAMGDAEYIEVPDVFMPVMASQLISNNVQVTFMVFIGGILAGIGSVFLLFLNGVMLGGVAGLYHVYGIDSQLWAFVLPHGVIELSAIVIAGGAALWMGSSLLVPGRQRRRDALVDRGQEAISLMGGVIMLLILAGFIEAFISPAPGPRYVKFAFATAVGGGFALYLIQAGRKVQQQDPDAALE